MWSRNVDWKCRVEYLGWGGFSCFLDLSIFFAFAAWSRNDRFCLLVEIDLLARCFEKLSLWWVRRANMAGFWSDKASEGSLARSEVLCINEGTLMDDGLMML